MNNIENTVQIIISFGTFIALVALLYQIIRDRYLSYRNQAEKISCWIDYDNNEFKYIDQVYVERAIIANNSNQPIYDVVISVNYVEDKLSKIQVDLDYSAFVNCVPPGNYSLNLKWLCTDLYKTYNAAICFRDINGHYWQRNAVGILSKAKSNVYRQEILPDKIYKVE